MAQSKDNLVTQGLSGTIGRMLTFRLRAGKTIVSKLTRGSSLPPTPGQLEVRSKFTQAIAYAKVAIKDPVIKAAYAAVAKPGQTAFNMACSDAFNPPTVESINLEGYNGLLGDIITIRATDVFKVTQVKVAIHNAAGDLLEQGDAEMQATGDDWLYTTTQVNDVPEGSTISVTALDLPGNETVMEVELV